MSGYEQPGLNATILKNFIAKRMKDSIDAIGFDSSAIVYDAELAKETEWFEVELYGTNMTDFFAKRPVEYSKGTAITSDDLF